MIDVLKRLMNAQRDGDNIIAQMTGLCVFFVFFFVKQKTAYGIRLSLVGSEMCIGDRAATTC